MNEPEPFYPEELNQPEQEIPHEGTMEWYNFLETVE